MNTNTTEIIATRTTADGVQVQFWTDGAVTMGTPRAAMPFVAKGLARRLAWLVAGDVALYDAGEVKALVKAARKAWDAYATHPRWTGRPMPGDDVLRPLMRGKFAVAAFKAA